MPERALHVLFLCTHNSARSVMAEALLNVLGAGRFVAHSAGSAPSGRVNPFAIEMAAGIGYDAARVRSKSWDEFALQGAAPMDLIITVCDNAAGEACPVWPGHPTTAHWGFPDPSAQQGGDEDKRQAFRRSFAAIRRNIEALIALPLASMSTPERKHALQSLHQRLQTA
jgi:protein-tyrosine-phosphatase